MMTATVDSMIDAFEHGKEGNILISPIMDTPKSTVTQTLKQEAEDEKYALASSLSGQQMIIPSFNDIFQDWARNTNGGYERLKPVLVNNFRL